MCRVIRFALTIACSFFVLIQSNLLHAEYIDIVDTMKVFKKEMVAGKHQYVINAEYLDQTIDAMWSGAISYPTSFKNETNKEIAKHNVSELIRLFSALKMNSIESAYLLYREAVVNHMGHNLDIKGAYERAGLLYTKLLEENPNNAKINHLYGFMLSNGGQPKKAIPYLAASVELGRSSALFNLSLAHLFMCEIEQAKLIMTKYLKLYPQDKKAQLFYQGMNSEKGISMQQMGTSNEPVTSNLCA